MFNGEEHVGHMPMVLNGFDTAPSRRDDRQWGGGACRPDISKNRVTRKVLVGRFVFSLEDEWF